MIWCIGLPRSGGQSLLAMFAESGLESWHSIQVGRWDVVKPTTAAVIECYSPIAWCLTKYNQPPWPTEKHKFVVNIRRDVDAWCRSCEKCYNIAQNQSWSHPLWRRNIDEWPYYYEEYHEQKYADLDRLGCDFITVDVTENNPVEAESFAEFTGLPKTWTTFPNYDRFARFNGHITPVLARAAVARDPRGGSDLLGVEF